MDHTQPTQNTRPPTYEEVQAALLRSILKTSYQENSYNIEEKSLRETESDPFLCDEIDKQILIHLNCHFGSHFPTMISYYENDGKGCLEEIEIERVYALAHLQQKLHQDLSSIWLAAEERKKIETIRALYHSLRTIYEVAQGKESIATALADLILTENTDPQDEINAIAQYGERAVEPLLQLLKSPLFHDTAYPGYGIAPMHAIQALGKIASSHAIIPLFETIGSSNFDIESEAIQALYSIGEKAQDFLLQRLTSFPRTKDVEKAAIALQLFKENTQVAHAFFHMLQDQTIWAVQPLATYVLLGCEGLKDPHLRQETAHLLHLPEFPQALNQELIEMTKTWQKRF